MTKKNGKGKRGNKETLETTVRKIVNDKFKEEIETKYHDYDVTTATQIPVGGANFYITEVSAGTRVTERLGQLIKAQRVELRGRFILGINQQAPEIVRMILFRDNNQGSQANTIIPDILEAGNIPTNQQYNWNNVPSSFQILADKRFVVAPGTEYGKRLFYLSIKKTMIMKYDGVGATPNGKGRLCLSFIADNADAATSPQVQFTSRVWYTDA